MTDQVTTTHSSYHAMLPYWQTMDDITKSEKQVKSMGTVYLTALEDMDEAQYEAYKSRAACPMFTRHTLHNFVGMAMRKEVMVRGLPQSLRDNIDAKGKTLVDYARDLVYKYLKYGRAVTLIDNDGRRPKLLLYRPQSLINWRTRVVNNVEVLSLAVLKEVVEDPSLSEGELVFTPESKTQYRVLYLDENNFYRQKIYSEDGKVLQEIKPKKRWKDMPYIPLIIHGGLEPDIPPLMQIAELNLSYYRLDADYKHGLHYVALPTPWTTGIDPKDTQRPKTLGSAKIWHLPDGATCGMLEFTGKGISGIKDAKNEIKDDIITLSSRILAPPMNLNETATAAAIRNAGDTASLAQIVGMLSRELTFGCRMASSWYSSIESDVFIEINRDFVPTILSGSDVASYVASWIKGGYSFHTLFNVLKSGEIQDGDRKMEDELADIKKEMQEREEREIRIALATGKGSSDYIPQEREGEGVNKGQMREN